MEPAQIQLARTIPSLCLSGGTSYLSIYPECLALTFMSEWNSFTRDAFQLFQEARITHDVPIHDENELYTVGNKIGLFGRFVRNLCEPVMKALAPLPGMAAIRFADYEALCAPDSNIPDICWGLTDSLRTPDNVYLVGEFKTPWTVPDAFLNLRRPDLSHNLEPLIGQLVAQMRSRSLRFGFLSTYNSTVFVKRAAECSFLITLPIKHDATKPSLRQLFAGQNPDRPPPSTNQLESITSNSVIISTDRSPPTVVDCIRQLSDSSSMKSKATWLASINGTLVILKYWGLEYDELFDAETVVYDRLWTRRPAGLHNFANWILRGEILCSSILPSGYVLVLERREGVERAHIQAECLNAIHALRAVNVRIRDAGMYNVLYSRESGVLTLLDFESAQEIESNSVISTYYEMQSIFRSSFPLGRPSGG
ncbi:hypothetical protein N7468_007834 [Penicillium chermesinum]|uniref:Uncharacterized protein n=1 Tax=Penicillium chermesinum TaxID=63820 RepID=A0A9W9THQ8_9EURO|nr:uncharacterized protein N7468_007834 [Penicillium chermesinum]KAJ5223292.1 hypothetical protein N7468_007834 [Penicillium chermesinum]